MGHSYVHWLERFAADQSKLPNSRNLLFDQCDVVYIGVRGATVDKLRSQSNLREVRRLSPDVVILHVGGNDIDQGVATQMIGMQVYQYREHTCITIYKLYLPPKHMYVDRL